MTTPSPLLQTRLRPPPLRAVVRREHLLARLDGGFAGGLSLIVGPPGFGKTTLAVDWLARLATQGVATAWLALSDAERDPTRFVAYLAAALRRLDPAIGAVLLSGDAATHEAALIALLNDLTALIEEQPARRFVLAIDDLHLAESSAVDSLLHLLTLHVPSGVHLLLISRIDPNLPLARLRAAARLNEIRERDLRFSHAEAGAFFAQTMGMHLPEQAIETLHGRTEGWAVGMQLAALAIRDSDWDDAQLIADFAASHRYVLDYLSDEVLRRLSPPLLAFLLDTALLNRMCASLCDALRASTDSGAILQQLEQSHLFVTSLDLQQQWYRYHHLFADLLRRESIQRDPGRAALLHQRAAAWYARLAAEGDQDALYEALHHGAAAGDPAELAQILDRHADAIWQRGELDLLRERVSALPASALSGHPRLAVHLAWLQITAGNYSAGEQTLALLDEQAGDAETRGRAAVCRAFLATFRGAIATVAGPAAEALALLEPASPWRGAAAIALGDARSLQGEATAATTAYEEALAAAGDNGYLALNAAFKLAGSFRMRGLLHEAAHVCRRAISRAEQLGLAESALAGCLYALYGDIVLEWDRLPEALELTARAMACIDRGRHVGLAGWIVLYRVRCLLAAGEYAAANAAIDSMQDQMLPPWISAPLTVLRALLLLSSGQTAAAEALLALRPPHPTHDAEVLLRARLLMLHADLPAALDLLDAAAGRCRAQGRNGALLSIELLRCTLLQRLGRTTQAIEALRAALEIGRGGDVLRSFREAGPVVAALLPAASTTMLNDYVNQIQRTTQPQAAAEPLLSEREHEILRLIAAGLKNREIAEQLLISLNTVLYHSKHLYSKLGAGSRTQALQAARERGLLGPSG